jgi:hypothetical protein
MKKNIVCYFLLSLSAISSSYAMEEGTLRKFPVCLAFNLPGIIEYCKIKNSFNVISSLGLNLMDSFKSREDGRWTSKNPGWISEKEKTIDISSLVQILCEAFYTDGCRQGKEEARDKSTFMQRHPKISAFGFTALGAAIPTSILGWMWWKTRN